MKFKSRLRSITLPLFLFFVLFYGFLQIVIFLTPPATGFIEHFQAFFSFGKLIGFQIKLSQILIGTAVFGVYLQGDVVMFESPVSVPQLPVTIAE